MHIFGIFTLVTEYFIHLAMQVLFLNHTTLSADCNYCGDVLQQYCSWLCSCYYSNTYFTFNQLDLQYLKSKKHRKFSETRFLMEHTSVLCFFFFARICFRILLEILWPDIIKYTIVERLMVQTSHMATIIMYVRLNAFADYFDSTLFSQVQLLLLVKGWKF